MLDRVRRLPDRWPWLRTALDVQRRFDEVHGGYLAGAVTLAMFLSLFPVLLVAAAVIGFLAGDRPNLGHDLVAELGVPAGGDAARAILDAIETARDSKATASVVGLVGLLWSGLGLVAALQYAYDAAWQVSGRGIRDKLFGLLWLVGSGLVFVASFALTAAIQVLPAWMAPLNLVAGMSVSTALFLWSSKALANVDIGWRPLLPGAVLTAVGFEVLKVVGGIYVPRAVASSSALYGSLGVVFAILAWLFFFGRILVYGQLLNVVRWERRHGTVHLDQRVPNLPRPTELQPEATRDGAAVPV